MADVLLEGGFNREREEKLIMYKGGGREGK